MKMLHEMPEWHDHPSRQSKESKPIGEAFETERLEMRLHEDDQLVNDVVAVEPREHGVGVKEEQPLFGQRHPREQFAFRAFSKEPVRDCVLHKRTRLLLEVRRLGGVNHDIVTV